MDRKPFGGTGMTYTRTNGVLSNHTNFINKNDLNVNNTVGYGNKLDNVGIYAKQNNNNNRKYDNDEISKARESLKLLKNKMGSGGGVVGDSGFSGAKTGINYTANNRTSNNPYGGGSQVGSTTQNSNFRKAFKPNLDENDNHQGYGNPKININNNKAINSRTTQSKNGYDNGYNKPSIKPKPVMNSNFNQRNNSNFVNPIEEQPAVSNKQDFREILNEKLQEEEDDDGDINRIACPTCGRKFVIESLEKHKKVCKKVFKSKRKAFNIKEARAINEDHLMMLRNQERMQKKGGGMTNNTKKPSKWKKQSEEFRAILKAGKEPMPSYGTNRKGIGQPGYKGGANTVNMSRPMPQMSSITDDYTLCNMCSRKYNETAYDKHLPHCERKFKESQMKAKYAKPSTSSNSKPNLNVRFNKR